MYADILTCACTHTHQTIISTITQINEAKTSACAHSDGGDNYFFKDSFTTIGYLLRITSTKQSRAASRTSLKTPCCAYWRNILASLGRWPKRWNVRIARKQLHKHRWLYSHKHFCIVWNYSGRAPKPLSSSRIASESNYLAPVFLVFFAAHSNVVSTFSFLCYWRGVYSFPFSNDYRSLIFHWSSFGDFFCHSNGRYEPDMISVVLSSYSSHGKLGV